MNILMKRLLAGASTIATIAGGSLIGFPAMAQDRSTPVVTPSGDPADLDSTTDDNADEDMTTIVVTGTSIRGVAPVGANLVSVGRDTIERTGAINVQQILKTVPSITAAGSAGVGQTAGNAYYAPTIHSLGSSASNSTLVLADGHRLPVGGWNHALTDPGMIPPIAIQRVEVLAEGASSTYGSDAVAGVVNFVTRSNFDGLEATAQAGFADDYESYSAGLLWGQRWETGSVMAAFGYSRSEPLAGDSRSFLQPNHIDEGGTNFQTFNCSPATIQPNGTGNIYLSPDSATSVANTSADAPCDDSSYTDILPLETRYNALVKIRKDVGDRLSVGLDMVYSYRNSVQQVARGGLTTTVFNSGSQANPFYTNPPGVTADRQTIRWQSDDLLGPGANLTNKAKTWYLTANLEYEISDAFRFTAFGLIGDDVSSNVTTGTLCQSCANLALNGTTLSGGSLTQPSIPGTTIFVNNLPLNTGNALDVWNTGSANRTSPEVIAMLTDNRSATDGHNVIKQFRAGIDGELFDLPGGAVKIAVGGELLSNFLETSVQRPNNTGPASSGSQSAVYPSHRTVGSAYGELLLPLVNPEMNIPLVYQADVNVSARYDHYSDFGSTTNPKFAANWEIVRGLRLRGNWSTSFVAPSQRSLGDSETGRTASSSLSAFSQNALVPVSLFPDVVGIPGCNPGATTCTIGGNIQGVRLFSGNPDLDAQEGTTWSIGADLMPVALPGLRAGITLFDNKFEGGVNSPPLSAQLSTASLAGDVVFFPNGATPAELATALARINGTGIPLGSALPTTIYYLIDWRQKNVLNLHLQGIDVEASYRFNTGMGEFTLGGSGTRFHKFEQNLAGGETFSVLNTTGYNLFPSIKLQARLYAYWEKGPFSANIFYNYIGSHQNWARPVDPITLTPTGVPNGGGDRVKATQTVDLHAGYTFTRGMLEDAQVYIDVNNLFDTDPPFYNSASGYDSFSSSPLGRIVAAGVRISF